MEQYGPRPRAVALELRGRDLLAEALQQGKGAILLTAHLGNWEIAASRLFVYGRPVNMVMGHELNPTTHDFARQVREQAPVRIIYADTSVFSPLKIVEALRRNEIVAIQLDRPLGMGGPKDVPFFGVSVPLPCGPFALARLSGAPMIPAFVPRVGRRHYVIRLGGTYGLGGERRGSSAETRAMEVVARVFEEIVREYPTQWFQFGSFWATPTREPLEKADTGRAA
jgi:KDO2-lipid IV(A) lauroyltransferase